MLVTHDNSKRRRRSRHRKQSIKRRRFRLAVTITLAVIAFVLSVKGMLLVLADYEERRNIYATVQDCATDYQRSKCRHVPHNELWYGPWYRAPSSEAIVGPNATDIRYRKPLVLNVERRDPKKIFSNRE